MSRIVLPLARLFVSLAAVSLFVSASDSAFAAATHERTVVDDGTADHCPKWQDASTIYYGSGDEFRVTNSTGNPGYDVEVAFKNAAGAVIIPPNWFTVTKALPVSKAIPEGAAKACVRKPGRACTEDCALTAQKVPAASTWGLAALTLLILAAGTVIVMRRRAAVA